LRPSASSIDLSCLFPGVAQRLYLASELLLPSSQGPRLLFVSFAHGFQAQLKAGSLLPGGFVSLFLAAPALGSATAHFSETAPLCSRSYFDFCLKVQPFLLGQTAKLPAQFAAALGLPLRRRASVSALFACSLHIGANQGQMIGGLLHRSLLSRSRSSSARCWRGSILLVNESSFQRPFILDRTILLLG
jgi:hypothetical protein